MDVKTMTFVLSPQLKQYPLPHSNLKLFHLHIYPSWLVYPHFWNLFYWVIFPNLIKYAHVLYRRYRMRHDMGQTISHSNQAWLYACFFYKNLVYVTIIIHTHIVWPMWAPCFFRSLLHGWVIPDNRHQFTAPLTSEVCGLNHQWISTNIFKLRVLFIAV